MSVATVLTTTPDPAAIRLLPDPGTGRPVDRSEPDLLRYLSASRLKCWQSCRRQFYFRYVERLVVPTAPALFIGRQIHEVLRLWNWGKWKNEPLSPEQLHAALNEGWTRDAAAEFIPWKKPEDEVIARDQAWAMLEAYFAQCPVAPDERPEGVEVEVECSLGAGIPPLYGIIDLVRPPGRIIDYKSAARSPSEGMTEHQHATQLACYALLYRSATGERETGFELHHLIKTKVPKVVISTYGRHLAGSRDEASCLYAQIAESFPAREKLADRFAFEVHLFQIAVPESLGMELVSFAEQQEVRLARREAAETAARQIRSGVEGFVGECITELRHQTAQLCDEMLTSMRSGKTDGVHQKTLNRLVKFIDDFKQLNFAGDVEMESQLDRVRSELLTRSAEDYRNNLTATRSLETGLSQLRDQARELASQDARALVERFGQMGRRKLQLAG